MFVRMLQDSTNTVASAESHKRALDSDGSDAVTKKLRASQSFGFSSSSSPAPVSSSPFPNTRFAAYDAPSSPDPSSYKGLNSPSRPTSVDTSPFIPEHAYPSTADAKSAPTAFIRDTIDAPLSEAGQGEPFILRLERDTVVQFGRKAKKPTCLREETTLAVRLPPAAKNASRLHCTVRIAPLLSPISEIPTSDSPVVLQVQVLGQNGMKINGRLWKAGSLAVLPKKAGDQVKLSFWGWDAILILAESEKALEKTFSPQPLPADQMKTPKVVRRKALILPTSSPYDSLFDGSSQVGDPVESSVVAPSRVRSPSPAPSLDSVLSFLSSPVKPPSGLDDEEGDGASSEPHREPNPLVTKAKLLASSLVLDLPGLIASAIVFQPRATVGVEEVVRSLLTDVGAMWTVIEGGRTEDPEAETAAIEAWWEVVETCLRSQVFFGCIENVGLRDASGNPLLPAYYYIPDRDPVASRVEALEPFVKRVRNARTTGGGKRYFWRRPQIKKNR